MNPELPDSEEKRLLASLQKGHKEAMGVIFDQYYTDLYHYGRRVCNDPAQVEDSIQELFVQLWQKREEAGKIARLKPYLLGALRNMLLKSLQRQQRQTGLPDNEAQWAHEAELPFEMRWIVEEEQAATDQKLQAFMAGLAPRQQEIIHLKFFQGLSYDEIEQAMHIRRQSVHNLLREALTALRKQWVGHVWLCSFLLEIFF